MENCKTTSKNKIFTFKEQRSLLTLLNKDQVTSVKIQVDGCEINDVGIKCDYMHIAKEIEMYIELKGHDLIHALHQIERTIGILSSDPRNCKKISYVICTRSPLTSTEIQIHERQFRAKFNSKLIIKSSPYTDTY